MSLLLQKLQNICFFLTVTLSTNDKNEVNFNMSFIWEPTFKEWFSLGAENISILKQFMVSCEGNQNINMYINMSAIKTT